MKLSVLLFVLARRLQRALRTRPAFQSHVRTVKLRILIKTADDRHGRLFIFDRGRITTMRGSAHRSDAALVWSDPTTAFRVMASGSDEASFLAASQGKLRIEGMAAYIQWFTEGVKLAA